VRVLLHAAKPGDRPLAAVWKAGYCEHGLLDAFQHGGPAAGSPPLPAFLAIVREADLST